MTKRQPGGGRKPSQHLSTRQWFAFRDDGERAIVMELTPRQRAEAVNYYCERIASWQILEPSQTVAEQALVRISYENDEELALIKALSRAERTDACVQYYLSDWSE